jgi:hypothetical protein
MFFKKFAILNDCVFFYSELTTVMHHVLKKITLKMHMLAGTRIATDSDKPFNNEAIHSTPHRTGRTAPDYHSQGKIIFC